MKATTRQLGEIRDGINTAHFIIMLEETGEGVFARWYAREMVPRMPRLTQRAYARVHQRRLEAAVLKARGEAIREALENALLRA